jgi:hypothetical protein
MDDLIKKVGITVLSIFAAGAALNLLAKLPGTKPVADFITKGYGSL